MNELLRVVLRSLQRPLLVTLLSVGLAAMVLVAADAWHVLRHSESKRAQRNALDAEQQQRNVADENRALESSLSRFQALRERGVIGPPQRLDWTELLITTGEPLLAFDYRFSPAEAPAAPAEGSSATAFKLLPTPMQLKLALRHEGELIAVMRSLTQGRPLLRTRSCELGPTDDAELRGALQADCQMDWLSVVPPASAAAAAPAGAAAAASAPGARP